MTIEEIEAVLAAALPLRVPRFPPDERPRTKVSALEDYMLTLAYHHGELEEALHWLDAVIARLSEKIGAMTGFEAALPSKPRDRITEADRNSAKRRLDPATFAAGARAKELRTSVLRQIARFEFDQTVVSRAYSLISGS